MAGLDNHFIINLHIDSNPPLATIRNGQPLLELAKSNSNPKTKRREKKMSNGGVGSKVDPMSSHRLSDPSQGGGAIPSFVLSTLPMMHIPGGSPHLTVRDSVRICYTGKRRGPDEKRKTSEVKEESRKSFVLQTSIPFLLAGCGMVAAGILLDNARQWQFLRQMPEALILVPALLGLKGNLEMTLASRLSTMANLGLLDDRRQKLAALVSNVSLIQAQAIVVSLVAALIAIVSYRLEGNPIDYPRAVCLILASILTASVCSLILASLMVGLAIMARRFKINPDNIATPLAAATGDTVTLSFLVIFGTLIFQVKEKFFYINIAVTCLVIASTAIWMYIASREYITLQVLKFGWFAVLMAMLISSGGGYVLRHSVSHFPSIALFQPVINGVGGNLVSVQSSKISTYLHQFGQMGMLPANRLANYLNPLRAFSCKEEESVHSAILLLMSIPGHAIFFLGITVIQKDLRFNAPFFALYMFIAIMQVSVLLYICQAMCRIMWLLWINPDNNSIPILTALGDLLGSSLLAAAFYGHSLLNAGRISVSTTVYEANSAYVSENSSLIFAGDLTGGPTLTPTAAFNSV